MRSSSGFVGADIAAIVRDAFIRSLRRAQRSTATEEEKKGEDASAKFVAGVITKTDLENAILDAKPSSIKDIVAEVPKVRHPLLRRILGVLERDWRKRGDQENTATVYRVAT